VSSSDRSERGPLVEGDLDLERGLPTTADDVTIQRRLRGELRLSSEEYERFLRQLGPRPYEELLARKGPQGEPFEL
jgi:hypothetical protein